VDEVTAGECEVSGTSSLCVYLESGHLSLCLWSPVVDEVTARECVVTSTSSLSVSLESGGGRGHSA